MVSGNIQPLLTGAYDWYGVVLVTMGTSMLMASPDPAFVTIPSLYQSPAARIRPATHSPKGIVKLLVMSVREAMRNSLQQWKLCVARETVSVRQVLIVNSL